MTHYAISFYVINQAYGDGHPLYWIPPSKHIKMQFFVKYFENLQAKCTENIGKCTLTYFTVNMQCALSTIS
jgi:hypothetical protein